MRATVPICLLFCDRQFIIYRDGLCLMVTVVESPSLNIFLSIFMQVTVKKWLRQIYLTDNGERDIMSMGRASMVSSGKRINPHTHVPPLLILFTIHHWNCFGHTNIWFLFLFRLLFWQCRVALFFKIFLTFKLQILTANTTTTLTNTFSAGNSKLMLGLTIRDTPGKIAVWFSKLAIHQIDSALNVGYFVAIHASSSCCL